MGFSFASHSRRGIDATVMRDIFDPPIPKQSREPLSFWQMASAIALGVIVAEEFSGLLHSLSR
jgi:hypothetical protein